MESANGHLSGTGYVATTTAWNDGQRGVVGGAQLSCWGGNITDATLMASDGGKNMTYVRPPNLDETLGVTTTDEVSVTTADGTLTTVDALLRDLPAHEFKSVDIKLGSEDAPPPMVVRVQSAWIGLDGAASRDVAPAHYSYQTLDSSKPKNLLIVCTPSGICVHADDVGHKRLLIKKTGTDEEAWFRMTASEAKVGEAAAVGDAKAKKRAGVVARRNAFVVVSVPLEQEKEETYRSLSAADGSGYMRKSICYRGGCSFAATIGEGASAGTVAKRDTLALVRDTTQPLVVTVIFFNVLEDGEVQKEDLLRAVAEMDAVYAACKHTCKLSQLPAMLHTLKDEHMEAIRKKAKLDPFVPQKDALGLF